MSIWPRTYLIVVRFFVCVPLITISCDSYIIGNPDDALTDFVKEPVTTSHLDHIGVCLQVQNFSIIGLTSEHTVGPIFELNEGRRWPSPTPNSTAQKILEPQAYVPPGRVFHNVTVSLSQAVSSRPSQPNCFSGPMEITLKEAQPNRCSPSFSTWYMLAPCALPFRHDIVAIFSSPHFGLCWA